MSAATLDFEDVRVLEEKETFELIGANEASTAPQQPPKMLTTTTTTTTTTKSENSIGGVGKIFKGGNRNNGKLLLNFESSKRKASASPAFKSNRRKSANGSRSSDIGRIAKDVCNQLNEPKVSLMRRAVDNVGCEMVSNLAVEVQNIESKGGMQTADGSRRRTPGGVFWALFKQRVSQEVYEDVFAEEKEKARERQRKRKSVQRAKLAVESGEQDMDTSMSPPSTVEKASAPSSSPSWATVAKTPATIKVKTTAVNNMDEDLTEELPSYEEMVSDNVTPKAPPAAETMAAKLFKSNSKNSGFFKPGKEKQDSMFGGKEKQDAPTASFAEKLDMVTPKASLNTKKAWADEDEDMFAAEDEELLNAPVKKAADKEQVPKWTGASFASIITK
jgi:hypothetical protein